MEWFIVIASAVCFFFLQGVFDPPLSYLPYIFVITGAWALVVALWPNRSGKKEYILELLGKKWEMGDLCRGWFISGVTGSGKTFLVNRLNVQLLKKMPNMGMLCLDFKGVYWQTLQEICISVDRAADFKLIQARKPDFSNSWKPPFTINLIGNDALPAGTYAKVLAETFHSIKKSKPDTFFCPTAQRCLELGIDILRTLNLPVTIPQLYDYLRDPETAQTINQALIDDADTGNVKAGKLHQTIKAELWDLPAETKGGVLGQITLYLVPYLHPSIAETFCAETPNLTIDTLDQGAIISISLPQIFQEERLFINSIVKLLGMFHVLSRFDLQKEELKNKNFILVQADEGQELITAAESALADYRIAGTMREARATLMIITQAITSLYSVMEKQFANTLMVNLANWIVFQVADDDSAKVAAKKIGERYVTEKTWGIQGGRRTYNYSKKLKAFLEPHELRGLKKFQAVVLHCEKGWKKGFLPPVDADGKVSSWYTGPR